MEEISEENGGSQFEARCQEAQNLGAFDFKGAKACLINCRNDNLTSAQTMMVMSIIVEVTGLDNGVVRALQKEVRNEHQIYGVIDDVAGLGEALTMEIGMRNGHIKVTDGALYTYRIAADHESFGIWVLLPETAVDQILIESFSVDLTARPTMRREAIRRFYTSREEPDAFAGAATGLALDNGFLRYDAVHCKFELLPHSPEYLARNKVEVAYVPHASSRNFRRGLLRVFGGDTVKMTTFLEFVACAVFGAKPAEDTVRTCLTLFGSQRTGKSTLLDFARLFFMDEQVASLSPEHLGKPEKNVHLAGKALNIVAELQVRKPIRGDTLKQALSHEDMLGRKLYKDLFNFTPRCFHLWACNQLPVLDETHPSIMRRFIVIEMGQTLTDAEAAESFDQVIENEAEGIVSLLAKSFCDVMKRGRFVLPVESDILVSRMQFGDEIAPLFNRFHLEARPGARVTTEDLTRALRAFAIELGKDPDEAVHYGTMRQLAGLMRAAFGAVRRKTNGRPFYEGVGFKAGGLTELGLNAGPAEGKSYERLPVEVDLSDM